MADDDPALLASLRAGLGPGYNVRAAGTGEAALVTLARDPVDLVFLADRLPDVPGIPLLREIKEWHPQVLVFLMTAAGSEDLVIACIDNGGRAYLRKPFDPAGLRPFIEQLLLLRWRQRHERRTPIFLDRASWRAPIPPSPGPQRPREPVLLASFRPLDALGEQTSLWPHRSRRGRGAAGRNGRPPYRKV